MRIIKEYEAEKRKREGVSQGKEGSGLKVNKMYNPPSGSQAKGDAKKKK